METGSKTEYKKEQQTIAEDQAYMLPPEKRHDDFVTFVNDTWFPLQVQGNNRKAKTVWLLHLKRLLA